MAVSRRLRFEILRRDNHQCRYCGAAAPDVKLTVDHVVPTALGGSDEATNLVTACQPCNAGKAATSVDAPLVADIKADAVRWARAIEIATGSRLADRAARDEYVGRFEHAWHSWKFGSKDDPQEVPRPGDWEPTIWNFYGAGLPIEEVEDAVKIAATNSSIYVDNVFRYFCGVCYRKLEQIRQAASDIVTTLEED